MTWIVLAFGVAFFQGSVDTLTKSALRTHRARTMALVRAGWCAAFLFPLLIFAAAPSDPGVFWGVLAVMLPLEVAAILLYHAALRAGPLSATVPYLAFTPVFILGTAWAFLGERPTLLGAAGVCLITAGAFALQSRSGSVKGVLAGFFRLERGALLMLGAAFIYSLTSALAKRALEVSSPLAFSGVYFALLAVLLIPFQFSTPQWARAVVSRPRLFGAIGLLEALVMVIQFHAFLMAEVAYVISIKRMSILFAIAFGRIFFREAHTGWRFAAAALMVAGAALILLR